MSQTSPENQLKEALAALSELKTLAEGFKSKAEIVASADERISKVESAVEEIKALATSMSAQVETLAKRDINKDVTLPAKDIAAEAADANSIEGVNKTIVKSKKKDALAAEEGEDEEEEMEDEEEEVKSKKSKKAKKAAEAEEDEEEEDEDEDEEEEIKSKKSKKAGDIPPQFLKNIKKKKEEMEEDNLEKKTKGAEAEDDEEDMEDEEEETKSKKSKKAAEVVAEPVAQAPAAVEAPATEAPAAPAPVAEVTAPAPAPVAEDTHAKEIAELKAKFEAELKTRDEALASVGKMKAEFESLLDRINAYEASNKSAEDKVAKAVAQMGAEPVIDAPVAEEDKPKTAEDLMKEWQSIKDAKESRAFYLKHEETIRNAAFGKVRRNA